MSLVLGCIADDYTGASDLANTLTQAGLRTVQTIGIPGASLALPEIDAVVVALKIRSVPAAEAVARAREAHRWMLGQGVAHAMYKVCSTFDSTDAGNIGPVGDALRADSGDPIIVVTPAFPGTNRTVFQGNLFVGAVPLNESPLKDHPLNPMHDANLVRVLGRQSAAPVGLLDLATVAGGPDAVRRRLAKLATEGKGAAIADAVFDRDLESLGAATLDAKVSVGASGLGFGLARALLVSNRVKRAEPGAAAASPVGGLSACLAGSCSAATLEQVRRAEGAMPVRHLDANALLAGEDEVGRALAWVDEHLERGPLLIASSAGAEEVAALQARYGRHEAGQALEAATARIAEALVGRGVRRLVVAGGETSGAVVDRLGLPAFLIGQEIAPGVPVLRTLGGGRGDMLLALKSGNFGGADFFTEALALMN